MRKIFVGPKGIRSGWRFLIFAAICLTLGWASAAVIENVLHYHGSRTWTATDILLDEAFGALGIVVSLIAAFVMSRIEERRMGAYGLPLTRGSGGLLAHGLLWGFASVALLTALIAVFGGVRISGLALHGGALARSALLWAVAMMVLGVSEEFMFRGYPQFTFATGIGFWPAAIAISLLFGGLHYFGKGNLETPADGLSVTLLAIFLALTLRRTGNLWFAVGWHAAFDYAALVVVGAPNTGNGAQPIRDHLLATAFQGPAWKTGGPCGIEASWLIFPVIALLFILFDRLYPVRSAPQS